MPVFVSDARATALLDFQEGFLFFMSHLRKHDTESGRILAYCDLSDDEVTQLSKLMQSYTESIRLLDEVNKQLGIRGWAQIMGRGDCIIIKENED